AEVFRHIKNIRYFFLDDYFQTPANWSRYQWYVENLINKYTLLPTGEVTVIRRGNPSGQISTTTDNIMVNTFLTAFEYCHQKLAEGVQPYAEEFFENHRAICYGDDRLSGVKYKPNIDLIVSMYEKIFGMWVKPEKIKLHKSCEGATFCGFTFKKHEGRWVGEVNCEKLLSTLKEPVRALPDIQALWTKLVSLRLLSEHSDGKTKDLLEASLAKVEAAMVAEGIEPIKLPRHFYQQIW
ncbi:RNA-dependent RNA polymerase, partial [Astroviridae sp.]